MLVNSSRKPWASSSVGSTVLPGTRNDILSRSTAWNERRRYQRNVRYAFLWQFFAVLFDIHIL